MHSCPGALGKLQFGSKKGRGLKRGGVNSTGRHFRISRVRVSRNFYFYNVLLPLAHLIRVREMKPGLDRTEELKTL